MEKTEYRNKRMMVYFTESEYEQLLAEAEKSHIPKAVLCRKLIVDGFVRIEYREPAEMSMLVSAPRCTPPMPPVAKKRIPAMEARIIVVATVVAPVCFMATR